MKKIFAGLTFIALALAGDNMRIQLTSRVLGNSLNAYDLACTGAQGNIRYYVTGLPTGVTFSGNTIAVTNSASAGSYPVTIRAVDDAGRTV